MRGQLILAAGALAVASCGVAPELAEDEERESFKLYDIAYVTGTVRKDQHLVGWDPYFDRLSRTMFKTTCKKLMIDAPKSTAVINWVTTSEQLKDALKASGQVTVSTGTFEGSGEGHFAYSLEKYTEDLYFLVNFETAFVVSIDMKGSGAEWNDRAKEIIDAVTDGTTTPHDGAVDWLSQGGPGYIASETRGSSMMMMIKLHSENAHTNLDLAGKIGAKVGAAGFDVAKAEAELGKQITDQLNKMQVNVYVRARGFTLPAGKNATDALVWNLVSPPQGSTTPFTSSVQAAIKLQASLNSSTAAAFCVVNNRINSDNKVCKDGDTVVTEDLSSLMRFSARPYSSVSFCPGDKNVQEMFRQVALIQGQAMDYAENYRMVTMSAARGYNEIKDAIDNPPGHSFMDSKTVDPPIDAKGVRITVGGFYKNFDPGQSEGQHALANVKRKACLDSVSGAGAYEPKCTPKGGAESEAEFKNLRDSIKTYRAAGRVPAMYYTANKDLIEGRNLAAFSQTCTANERQLTPSDWIPYLSMAQGNSNFTRFKPFAFWISNQNLTCPANTSAVAILTLDEIKSQMKYTTDCYSTTDPPPTDKPYKANGLCVSRKGIFGETEDPYGLSAVWRRPSP